MKRNLAILALFGVVLVLPLSATALMPPAEAPYQPQSCDQVVQSPSAADDDGDIQGQQDSQGDPDELGGGFRNNGAPPRCTGTSPIVPPWIGPLFVLVLQLF